MRIRLFSSLPLAALLVSPMIGCSGGGARSDPNPDDLAALARCILTIGQACAPAEELQQQAPGTQTQPPTFTSWTEVKRDAPTEISGSIGFRSGYASAGTDEEALSGFISFATRFHYDPQGRLISFSLGQALFMSRPTPQPIANLGGIGQGWLDYSVYAQRAPGAVFTTPNSPFFSPQVYDIELIANPFVLGWNYQSFGVWDAAPADFRTFGGQSFGAPTPASAVPTNGSATFTGKLAGFYMPSTGAGSLATAALRVDVNFGTPRSLQFSSSDTMVTRDLVTTTPAPNLNLSGTLTFSGSNEFTGTLTNAGGTMSGTSRGRFYGPAAEELGGAFALRSGDNTEKFSGAYGARR
jgi:hypothetical protein